MYHTPQKNVKIHFTILLSSWTHISCRSHTSLPLLECSSIFYYSSKESGTQQWNRREASMKTSQLLKQHTHSPVNVKPTCSVTGGNWATVRNTWRIVVLLKVCILLHPIQIHQTTKSTAITTPSAKAKYFQFGNPNVFTHTLYVVVSIAELMRSNMLNMYHRIIRCSGASLGTFYIITYFY